MLTIWLVINAGLNAPPIITTEITMSTSWYGQEFQGHKMANGERFDRNKLIVAHRDLPLGTEVLLTNPQNNQRVRAIIKDRGPYVNGRNLDVSERVARKLNLEMNVHGVAPVVVQLLKE